MSFGKHINAVARVLAAPIVAEWPLWLVWLVGMSIGGVCDISRIGQEEFVDWHYVRGVLFAITYNLCLSALVAWLVAAVARWCRWRGLRWMLAAVALLMAGTFLFIRYHYGSRLTPEIATVIRETNRAEATEYLSTYLFSASGVPIVAACLAAMAAWCALDRWWHRRRGTMRSAQCEATGGDTPMAWWRPALVVIAAVVVAAGSLKMVYTWPVVDRWAHLERKHYDTLGVDALTNLLKCRYVLGAIDDMTALSIRSTQAACQTQPQALGTDSLTLVLVIGESYIRSHAGIYGYPKDTTPRQVAERDAGRLSVFTDIITPFCYTNMSMRAMLSVSDETSGQRWCDSPLFPAIFKHAGYEVDMWDNQREFMQGSAYTGGLNELMYNPQVMRMCYTRVNDRNNEFDGDLVNDYAAHRHVAPHRLVVLHLRGQHIKAERRYPHTPEHTQFTPDDYREHPFARDEQARAMVAHYDNATRYNDWVLGQIFDLFADCRAIVVCVADHGDEVYDYREGVGRRIDNDHPEMMARYQHEVPLVVWCSTPLLQARPELAQRITQATGRPGVTSNIAQMLLGLSGISTPWYHAERDILSPDYSCPKRTVRDKYDYDSLRQQVQ